MTLGWGELKRVSPLHSSTGHGGTDKTGLAMVDVYWSAFADECQFTETISGTAASI